ncbi:hypothetical protein BC936DRAFT_146003 [Jimgerdemannia flammicorona]|uniref:F-box domain-containing protein n=1 Tax=Jimgerdemannia flammicorona TaxID=994334 RepID=A0A433D9B8_9FUNG|nr:hypothetical protein BC936DRAFT_146003 [Jimgerdemannia flammicorona]
MSPAQQNQEPLVAPYLSPKVLAEIFRYVANSRYPTQELSITSTLDLMASSMVCTSWWEEARRHIGDKFFEHIVSSKHPKEFSRFADLLIESDRLGCDYHKIFSEIFLDTAKPQTYNYTAADLDSHLDSLARILELRPPNLTTLSLNLDYWSGEHEKCPGRRLCRFLERIEPYCGCIEKLVIGYQDDIHLAMVRTRATTFIARMNSHLVSLTIKSFELDDAMCIALRRCDSLRAVEFENVSLDSLFYVVHKWPQLRSFVYTAGDPGDMDRAVMALTASCKRLQKFVVGNDSELKELWEVSPIPVSGGALGSLLVEPDLKHLEVRSGLNVNDRFLSELARSGHALRTLILTGCPRLCGMEVNTWVEKPEIKFFDLRLITLTHCPLISQKFVTKLIERSPWLHFAHLPNHLNVDPAICALMKQRGFTFGDLRQWEKENSG